MFPIGDDNVRGATVPLITWALLALNILVFLVEFSLGNAGLEQFIRQFGVIPAEIVRGQDLHTLLTSMFLHGGWMHLIGNMLFLWVFSDNIEAVLGKIGFPIFYLLGGLAASAWHILSGPSSNVPSVGASGAIAAILGAYIVMFPQSRIRLLLFLGFRMGITRTSAIVFLGVWGVMQLFSGFASLGVQTAQSGGVAWFAHLGGFAFGLIVGLLFRGRASRLRLVRS